METNLESRIRKLERSNRVLSVVAGLAVVAALAGAASKTDVVQATRFEVLDGDGHVRGTFAWEGETASLELKDASRNTRVELGLMKDGQAFIGGYSRDFKASAALVVPNDNNPFVGILDRDGTEHAVRP